jgi:hypothetical protein
VAEELSLYEAMLDGRGSSQLGRLLEGILTAQVTSVLARLGLPDQLAGGPLAADQLAPRVGAEPDALSRLLTAAAGYGLVSRDSAGRYSLTPAGELLRSDVPGSARALAAGFIGPPMWETFGRLTDVVRNPEPVLREVPHGDLHVLSHVLHNWDDEHVRTIAGHCHRASHPGGGLLVIEYLLPDDPEPSLAHLMDLIMMVVLGGRERTRAEHEALLGPVGYTLVRDTPLTGVLPWRILEFERD